MVLTLDVGNTNTVLGVFEKDELKFVVSVSTFLLHTVDEYAIKINEALYLHKVKAEDIEGIIFSSVVPSVNVTVKNAIKLVFGIDPLCVGPGVKTGINIHCDTPSSVGSDLICECAAAYGLYDTPSLIIDFNTSTNIIVLDKNGSFSGVSIMPGVITSLSALRVHTAQLPQVTLDAPVSVVGKNTSDSMRSGIVFGSASAIDGMIDRIERETKENYNLLATGYLADYVVPYCTHKIRIEDNMVLKGLNLIYQKNIK